MIDAQKMHDGSLKIVDMNGFFSYIVAKIIGFTVGHSFFDPTSCHPGTKAFRMMVPPIIGFGQCPLRITSPAKFSAPDHQGFVQETALLQVRYQSGGSLVGFFTLMPEPLSPAGIPLKQKGKKFWIS